MIMKGLRMLIAAVGLIALAAILICQQTRIERLAAEAARLREQVQQQASREHEAERPTRPEPSQGTRPNSVPSLTEEQFHELLRLRGEVGVLRAQLAETAQHAHDHTMRQRDAGPVAQMDGDSAPKLSELPLVGELFVSRSNSVDSLGFDWALAQALDRQRDAVRQALSTPQSDLVGIGAELTQQGGYMVINRLLPGSPAERSGQIHPGDRILAVAQGDNAFVDARNLSLGELVQAIRGALGTPVQLQILPATAPPDSPPATVTLFRDQIKLKRQG
jgi:hypothetical protein